MFEDVFEVVIGKIRDYLKYMLNNLNEVILKLILLRKLKDDFVSFS